jgi:hypothetical protein
MARTKEGILIEKKISVSLDVSDIIDFLETVKALVEQAEKEGKKHIAYTVCYALENVRFRSRVIQAMSGDVNIKMFVDV